MPHTPSPTDLFRINMQFGYGPNTPPIPAPIPPATFWYDVSNWQIFLKGHGESQYLGVGYPNDNFDSNTEMATQDYQTKNGLPVTGRVDQATYNKAKSQGMPAYPPVQS